MNYEFNANKTTPEEAKDILTGLTAHGDEESQLMGVEQLKERILCAQSEEYLRVFNLDQFIPALLDLLDLEYNGNILFATIVCLNYMMSNLPQSISFIIKFDGVKKICAKLQNIEYVDVAEAAITSLNKLSSENPELVLECGGISSVLNTMDFFHPGVIIKAISTAANCCGSITLDNFELIKTEIPLLMSLLHREEKVELETSVLCFSSLTQAITNLRSVSGLETIAGKGLMRSLISLIQSFILEGNNSRVSAKAYNMCLKIITICITQSSKLLEEVVNQGIVNILSTAMEQLVNSTSKESDPQIVVLLELTDKLFPELPADYIPINHYDYYVPRRKRFPTKDPLIVNQENLLKNVGQENKNEEIQETQEEMEIEVDDPQEIFFKKSPQFLLSLGTSIIKHLVKFYTSSVNPDVHDRSLLLILKFIKFGSTDTLSDLLKDVPVSNLLSNMLSASEMHSKVIAILIANSLMEKLPDIFKKFFKREGVVHRIYELSIDNDLVTSVQRKIEFDEKMRLEEIERKKQEELEEQKRQEEEKKRIEEELKRQEEEEERRLKEEEEERKRLEEEEKKIEEVVEEKPGDEKTGDEKKGFFKNLLNKKKNLKPVKKEVQKVPPIKKEPVKKPAKRGAKKVANNFYAPPKINNNNVSSFKKISSLLDTQEWTYQNVIKFKDTYFPRKNDESINDWLATEELKTLKNMAEELKQLTEKSNGVASEQDVICLNKLCSFLSSGNLSEFELLSSGLTSSLLFYLTFSQEKNEKSKEDRLERLRLFSIVFLGLEFPDLQKRLKIPNNPCGVEPLLLLINILQDVLTQHEGLSIYSSLGKTYNLQSLFKKLPLKFERDSKESFLAPLVNKLATVDLLSTTKDLINFVCLQLEEEKRLKEEQEKKKVPVHQKLMNAIREKASKLTSPTNTNNTNSPPKTSLTNKISNFFSKKETTEKQEVKDEEESEEIGGLFGDDDESDTNTTNTTNTSNENNQQETKNEESENNEKEEVVQEEPIQEEDQPEDDQSSEIPPPPSNNTEGSTEDQLEKFRRIQNKLVVPRNILLFFNGSQLNECDTIFKSLRGFEEKNVLARSDFLFTQESVLSYKRIDEFTDINFSAVPNQENTNANQENSNQNQSDSPQKKTEKKEVEEKQEMNGTWRKFQSHPFDSTLDQTLTAEQKLDKIVLESITLLSIFRLISTQPHQLYHSKELLLKDLISQDVFLNKKLSSQVKEQLEEPLSIATQSYPFWINFFMIHAPFLFPYNLRQKYFETNSFGIARSLANLEVLPLKGKREFVEGSEFALDYPLIHKEKVRISKQKLLQSAQIIMEVYGHSKSNLEVSYFGQEGIGLGPTKQFYTTLSQKLQKKSLGIWLDNNESNESKYVSLEGGLFPSPIQQNVSPTVSSQFELMGTLCAKALVDNRIFNLPLSLTFLKLAIGNEKLNWEDLKSIVGNSKFAFYKSLNESCLKKKQILSDSNLSESEKKQQIKEIKILGLTLEDLCLDWIIPGIGKEGYELRKGGKDIEFSDANDIDEYFGEVLEAYFGKGTERQTQAFRKGFSKVFPIENLSHFKTQEVYEMLCGAFDDPSLWTVKELQNACLVKHGYNVNDKIIQIFYKVISELSNEDKTKFLIFITGCPRLPVGGFRALQPQLTIVKKDIPSYAADYTLLSVMTCTNYIKLPEYTSEEILIDKIKTAINMSSGFYLT